MRHVDHPRGEHLKLGTDEVIVLAAASQTNGAMFAVQLRVPPGGGPPVMHRHPPGEIYWMLDGELAFYERAPDGAVSRRVAGARQVVALEGSAPHSFRNESDADAVAFVVYAPGSPIEGFVRDGAALGARGNATIDTLVEVANRYGIEVLEPTPLPPGS